MKVLTAGTFISEISNSALVLFGATWCAPCKILKDKLVDKGVDFCYLDSLEGLLLFAEYRVISVPTVILFRNKRPIRSVVGVPTDKQIGELVAQQGE